MVGHNAFGHPAFDTVRSPLGELLYQLKYRGNETVLAEIADTVATFLKGRFLARSYSRELWGASLGNMASPLGVDSRVPVVGAARTAVDGVAW